MKHNPRIAGLALLIFSVCAAPPASASNEIWPYRDRDLRGEWVYSGNLHFAAPIPFPGTLLLATPPHASFAPGDVVGIHASILGTMEFDGKGAVTTMEDVVKPGGVKPAPGFPLPFIPPLPEVGAGTYSVQPDGTVNINIAGRDPSNPVGQVDFEIAYHCQLNRFPREMQCVFNFFTTYFVDENGFDAPITGVIAFRKRY